MDKLPVLAHDLVSSLDKLYPAISADEVVCGMERNADRLLVLAAQRAVVEYLIRLRDEGSA